MTETTTNERSETTRPLIEDIVLTPSDLKGELVPYYPREFHANRPKPFWRRGYDFPLLVILPICLASVYLFLVASDRYTSETQFVVRTAASGAAAAGVASLVQTQGLSMATDETLLVNEYVVSRDVVRLLATNNDLRAILSRSEADPFVRFPNFYSRDDFEHLYWHFHRVIDVYLDQSAGITTLTTYAHRPEDARALAVAVMGYAEALINRLNDRAHEDALRYAQKTVDKTREKVADVQARLTEFRNSHGLVDPGRESAAALQTIEQLSEDQARLEAALGRQSALTPANPGNQGIRRQIDAYKTEIDKLKKQVVGTATSTAAALSAFESLVLERDIAAQSLQAAILNFEQARKQAQDERLYIETITAPHLSDYAEYPKRALDLMIVALVAVGFWLIVRSLRISAMEHAV